MRDPLSKLGVLALPGLVFHNRNKNSIGICDTQGCVLPALKEPQVQRPVAAMFLSYSAHDLPKAGRIHDFPKVTLLGVSGRLHSVL